MPRQARKMSNSGYLHIIARGVSRQAIFLEREDYQFYISLLRRYSQEEEVTICAYCLMENHVHLLVNDVRFKTPLMMKRIGISYSAYFNKKYDRCGHLFQDRYLSELIESEAYLLTAFRYILNNPAKAGICPADRYEWSSYSVIDNGESFVDCSEILELFCSRQSLVEFMSVKTETECMEYSRRIDDKTADRMIKSLFGVKNGMQIQKWDRESRNEALRIMRKKGMTVRQIERLTGIGRGIIQRA